MNADLAAEVAGLKGTISIVSLIGETLQLQRDGKLFIALCPFHGERTPSFTVYTDHYHCFGCGAHGDVISWLMQAYRMSFQEAVAHLGGAGRRRLQPLSPAASDTSLNSSQNVELARRIWCDSIDPAGTIVEAYLQHRGGLRLPDAPVIRFHPRCPRKRPEQPLPAMVSLMSHSITGDPCGVHRTFLQPDGAGKADVVKSKAMLGQAGVVRLIDEEWIGAGIGIAEGIETALTVTQRIGWGPCWAASSADAIRKFPVWRASTLNIFADHDRAGLAAARLCAARWADAGEDALIHLPPEGQDWLDAANAEVTL